MSASSRRNNEPAALVLVGDILKWVLPQVARFPKSYRFGLGARIEAALLDVMEGLVQAQYAGGGERRYPLEWANSRLQVARHLIRLAAELGLLSDRQLIHVAGMIDELGRQVGGWQKASARTASSSSSS